MPVAFGDPVLGAFVAAGADPLGGFGFDQLLHHHADRLADQIHAVTGAERLEQLGQGRLGQGHRWVSFSVCLAVHTEDPADGRLRHAAPPLDLKPHHPRGLSYDSSIGDSGSVVMRVLPVLVKPGQRTVHKWWYKNGTDFSSKQVRGNCYLHKYSYSKSVSLDCWAGRLAQVTYIMKVPASTVVKDAWIAGRVGYCTQGQLVRDVKRRNPTTLRFTVRVTNWRAFEVKSVNAKVKFTKRI